MEEKKSTYGRKKTKNLSNFCFDERWKSQNPEWSSKNMKKKFKWHDEKGRQLTAGGLLPYDDKGIWVIAEKKTKDGSLEWTDTGGKYKFEDCDIYTTISREVSEELYYSAILTRDAILKIKETHTPVYVNGHQSSPVYICYIVHIDNLQKYGLNLDRELFMEYRKRAILSNPDVPSEYYSSIDLKHLSFDSLKNYPLSYRLKRILKYGNLFYQKDENEK
jgi:hypothetical protein